MAKYSAPVMLGNKLKGYVKCMSTYPLKDEYGNVIEPGVVIWIEYRTSESFLVTDITYDPSSNPTIHVTKDFGTETNPKPIKGNVEGMTVRDFHRPSH